MIDCARKTERNVFVRESCQHPMIFSSFIFSLQTPPAVIFDCLSCLVVTLEWCMRAVLAFCWNLLGDSSRSSFNIFSCLNSSRLLDDDASTIDGAKHCEDNKRTRKMRSRLSATFFLLKEYSKWICFDIKKKTNFLLNVLRRAWEATKAYHKDWLATIPWMQCLEAKMDVSCCSSPVPISRELGNAMFLWLITPSTVNSLIEISDSLFTSGDVRGCLQKNKCIGFHFATRIPFSGLHAKRQWAQWPLNN